MEYECEITEEGKIIKSEDGKIWSGPDLWVNFSKCFPSNFEFKNIEHFFGLNYKPIVHKIEKLGDLSNFGEYVLYEDRKSK
ncbi:hypothetical protein NBO_78gi001 [Nosema bombycis CQ1]|uniref:Uncharacterized protein n=1 Tax=Nosema bombycis (strain CQ1 / CVCC 102059) TaxID=578461 RepID=R0M600_NOSB1|nr:hypothetical protein NBO_78gi001 [Nosema bombycis CQ1]|eukprot:EOB13384.1 hypothetical protein NBO_78gi001 [Nosema bombycis CQ1]